MKLLLDTHYLVWLAVEQQELSAAERALLEAPNCEIICSVASLWEWRLKWTRFHASGERNGPVDPLEVVKLVEGAGWPVLAISPAHAVTLLPDTLDHADQFDELLLVQAQVEGCGC